MCFLLLKNSLENLLQTFIQEAWRSIFPVQTKYPFVSSLKYKKMYIYGLKLLDDSKLNVVMYQKSMKKLDKTFELIKSLNKSEKRFFKIYSSRHVIGDENKYVQLFDAIEKQDFYNEEIIKEKFSGQKFINRMPVAKAYLYDLILKSMSAYHVQNSIEAQLYDNLKQIQFLFSKNLYQQAETLLNKTVKLAGDNDYLELMPEIMRWSKKLLSINNYKISYENLKTLCQEETFQIDQLELINKFWKLQSTLFIQHYNKGIKEHELAAIEGVFSERFMQLPNYALPFRAKLLKSKIYATYFYHIQDFESCYNYLKEMIQLLEGAEFKTDYYTLEYVEAISNILDITYALALPRAQKQYFDVLSKMHDKRNEYKTLHIKTKIVEAFSLHQQKINTQNKTSEMLLDGIAV